MSSARVAMLATVTEAGRPHIVPVTFAVDGGHLYTAVDAKPKRSPHLRRLRNILAHPQVAVLAQHYDDDWTTLWWVRADGRAAIVADPERMARPVALLAVRYLPYREHSPAGPVIDITVERWTGWAASPPA